MNTSRLAGLPALAFSVLALSAPALLAQEDGDTVDAQPAGEIVWTFGDKALAYVTSSSELDTMRIGSASVMPADPSDTRPDAPKMLTVMGFESLEGGGIVSLSLDFTTDPAQDGVVGRVDFTPDPNDTAVWVNGAEGAPPVTVTIDSYRFDGTSGEVTGHFAGDLCKSPDWDSDPDPKDCTAIGGSFRTEVYPAI
jgi:hypothetical protein